MKNEKSPFFISVVVPIDDLGTVEMEVLSDVQHKLDAFYWDYEILLVASNELFKENNSEVVSLLEKIPSIRYIQLQKGLSTQILFECGTENSIGDFVVLFDLNKDPISLIRQGVEQSAKGVDIIVGVSNFNNSVCYEIGRKCASLLLRISEYNIPQNASNFRVLSRRAVNAIFSAGRQSQDFFMRIQNCGFDWEPLHYCSNSRNKKNFNEGLRKTLDLMVFNSLKPLRLVSTLGFVGSFFAFFFALYSLVIQFVKTNVVEGWTSIFILISFFFLLQFVMLSFVSEYLARLLKDWNRESDYAVMFERNSRVMVNRDRINVMEEEETINNNLVQTGRNK